MPRSYYHAVRLADQTPQILVSSVAHPGDLKLHNTKFLPERRGLKSLEVSPLEWVSAKGEISQAAIALLEHATTAPHLSRRYAEHFQRQVLDALSTHGWTMRADQIRSWVARLRRQEQAQQQLTLWKTTQPHYCPE